MTNEEKSRWFNFISIAYSTRSVTPWEERVIEIDFSRDCADNLIGILGLERTNIEYNPIGELDGITNWVVPSPLDPDLIQSPVPIIGLCGKLYITLVDGNEIFDIKFR